MKLLFLLITAPFCLAVLLHSDVNSKLDTRPASKPMFDSTCASVIITPGSNSIQISGVSSAPIVGVQVFDNNWVSVFSQTYSAHGDVITVSPIANGNYFVNVRFYNNSWGSICEKGGNVIVSSNPPPNDTCKHTFQKAFGDAGADEHVIAMDKTTDGGYIVAGEASASGTTNYDGLLMKFDMNGNVLWSKTIGGSQQDYLVTIAAT